MELKKGKYQIQGLNLTNIAQEYGTPVYVYDTEVIKAQYKKMESAFSELNLRVKYAAKALSNVSVLKYVRSIGGELDVVSIQEAHLGLRAGFEPHEILFTPNGVALDEIKEGVDLGLVVNIDNISILEQFGHEYQDAVPCCIRLNPHIMAGGNTKISTGHVDSKFGISIYQLPHLIRVIKTYNIQVIGLHMHTGSDILDAEVFLKIADILFGVAKDFENLKFINFGSGFKVAYREGDITTNIYDLGLKLGEAFKDFCRDLGRELEVWFEPGKYLVSDCGFLVVRANVVKATPATVFVGVDSGMNHLLRPMFYGSYHEIINLSNTTGTKRIYTVVGNICETDTFGLDRKINEVREGDYLALRNAGAYGFSMASNYNSRLRPAEVMVIDGKAKLIRRRETLDDLLRTQIELDI